MPSSNYGLRYAQTAEPALDEASAPSLEIRTILEEFDQVFETPTTLPPARQWDHHIHLPATSKPVNVRPYRYPYFQKEEIEKQVLDMLNQGLIRHSTSPFSSPVLLVRKKDGSF